MTCSPARRRPRPGFTLIEMLIVIGIIGVLTTLLLSAAFRATVYAEQVRTTSDIAQLAVAGDACKAKFQMDYVPSLIILCENYADYFSVLPTTPKSRLHGESLEFISRMWPKIVRADRLDWHYFADLNSNGVRDPGEPSFLDWNGNNAPDPSPSELLLEGDQCLVFFLGGIPDNTSGVAGCLGFSTNPINPAQLFVDLNKNGIRDGVPLEPDSDRIPPFFEFKTGRLVKLPAGAGYPYPAPSPASWTNLSRSPHHYSYLDGYEKAPYAFFSSYKSANNYNRFYNVDPTSPNYYPYSDCLRLGFSTGAANEGIWPYAEVLAPSARYLKSSGFQIVSAGRDGKFGPGSKPGGGTWTHATASDAYPYGSDGFDDLSNFHDGLMGIPK